MRFVLFLSATLTFLIACESPQKGEKGDLGLQGAKGEQGIPGSIGPKGDKGDKGLKGEKGEKGGQGPEGLNGEKGSQGILGPKGDSGFRFELFDSVGSSVGYVIGLPIKTMVVYNKEKNLLIRVNQKSLFVEGEYFLPYFKQKNCLGPAFDGLNGYDPIELLGQYGVYYTTNEASAPETIVALSRYDAIPNGIKCINYVDGFPAEKLFFYKYDSVEIGFKGPFNLLAK